VIDTNLEEAKQAASGYITANISNINTSTAIDSNLKARGQQL